MKSLKLLIKLIILLTLTTITINAATALNNIVITQVLYNPSGSETGREAVELFNPTSNAIDVSGYVLLTERSSTNSTPLVDATLPGGTLVGANSYYLVADTGWSLNKDAGWPLADYEEAITLTNSDAGVALAYNSVIIDAVGWGDASKIGAGLYEGAPTLNVDDGYSVKRDMAGGVYVDTNNNIDDFYSSIPSFGVNDASDDNNTDTTNISINAIITGSLPEIVSISMDDDSAADGFQVSPEPKQSTSIQVSVEVSDFNGVGDIDVVRINVNNKDYQLQKTSDINNTNAIYGGSFDMEFYRSPGIYDVIVFVSDKSNLNNTKTTSFQYLSLVALEVDTSSITFTATPGQVSEILGDLDPSTLDRITLRNIGNTVLDIQIAGTDLTNNNNVINVGDIEYSLDGTYYALSQTKQQADINLEPGQSALQALNLRLNVPSGVNPGTYTGSILVTAIES
jgi:hypothetical protein